jgi:CRISPR/Cas system-associated exonuclease Cas4 (RecB family)
MTKVLVPGYTTKAGKKVGPYWRKPTGGRLNLEMVLTPHEPAWPDALPRHLSASSFKTFSRCPEVWRRYYLKGEKERPGAALVWGSADHYAHEVNFRQKIETREDLPVNDVIDAFVEGIENSIESNGGEFEVEWGDLRLEDMRDKGMAMVAAYHEKVSPLVFPVGVEEKFSYQMEHVPVPIIGFVDVETEKTVLDAKTAKQRENEPKPEWRMQALLYQIAREKPVEFHIKTKTKVPAIYTARDLPYLRLPFNQSYVDQQVPRIQHLVRRIAAMYAEFGPDEAWPSTAPDVGWRDRFCNYCGYRPNCKWMSAYGKTELRLVS